MVALDFEVTAVALAAGAALLLQGLQERIQFGFGPGQAGNDSGSLATTPAFVALNADEPVVRDVVLYARGRTPGLRPPSRGLRRGHAATIGGVDKARIRPGISR